MWHKQHRNTNIISTIAAIVVIVAVSFSIGCATTGTIHKGSVYQNYEGPKRASEDVAVIDNFRGVISANGEDVNKPRIVYSGMDATYPSINYYRAELVPGEHVFKVYTSGHKSGPAVAMIQAMLQPGHTYEFHTEYSLYAKNSSGFAVMLIDKANGDMVGGRTEEALKWSWIDVEGVLKQMKQNHASQIDVMESIGIPIALYPDEMLPEPARRGFKDPMPENTIVYRYTELTLPDAGYLFIKFNEMRQFEDYYYIAVPIDDCDENPLVWDWLGRFIREMSCRYRLKTIGYVEYYAQSGNPIKAYQNLENGILNAHNNIRYLTITPDISDEYYEKLKYREKLQENANQTENFLIFEGGSLMKRYPDMIKSALNTFTKADFKVSVERHGDNAEAIERERLDVFRSLVGEKLAQEAERELSNYFNVTLRH